MNNEIEKKYRVERKALKQVFNSSLIQNNYEFELLSTEKILDVYYDTSEMFLKSAGVLLRTRLIGKNKFITIKSETKQVDVKEGSYTTCKQFDYKIPANDSIYNYIDVIVKNMPFSIYASLKVDLTSIMNSMKPFLVIEHKSNSYHVYSNSYKCQFIFTELKYINQTNGKKFKEFLIELQNYHNNVNFEKFFEFANRIERSVKPIFELDKTKFELGLELTASKKK